MEEGPTSLADIIRAGEDPQALLEETTDAEARALLLETFGSAEQSLRYFFQESRFFGCSPYVLCKDKKPERLEMLKTELYNIQYGNLA